MQVWPFVRGIYRHLPSSLRVQVLALYRRLARQLPHSDSAAIVAQASRKQISPPHMRSEHNTQRVAILAPAFFGLDGNNMFYGGAERYLIELVRVIRELGYEPAVYQCANSAWVRYYADIRVVGIDTGGDMQRLNQQFHALVSEGLLTIYLGFNLATPRCHSRSIGISHGIYWDQVAFQALPDMQQQKLEQVLTALSNLDQVVSVDTNTINWVRATQANLAEKIVYIPNFVDPERFRPVERNVDEPRDDHIVILYPRRLYEARGFWLVTEVLPDLIQKHPKVEFHFVGRADPLEEETIRGFVERYPGHVRWYFLPPDRMHEAYQQADISLIPTVHSEGTSLSCLEALACGNAVVATNVGGLPDLILPGYNGMLIEPKASALCEALEQLIQDKALRLLLGTRGRQVAQAFNLERWRAQWQQILGHYLTGPKALAASHKPRVAVFPAAPGIKWEQVKQRPHHLALQLASHGIETFWRNPDGRQPSPHSHLHILAARDDLHVKEPLLFIYYPYHFANIEQFEEFGHSFVVYDVLDDISIHDRSDSLQGLPTGTTARDYHLKLLERADLVLASSRVLHDRVKAQRPDALFIPNGVDLEHFGNKTCPSAKLARLRGPIIGYHGAIAEWFDYDLFLRVVQQRPCYQFVLIGPVSQQEQLAQLISQPNVYYLGSVPYEQMPSYVAGFDVGILPFVLNTLTEGVRPLKVLECLAMGKPVVATPLPDLVDWPGVLKAHEAEQFATCLDQAIESRASLQRDSKLAAFVAASAWPVVIQPLLRALNHLG